MLNQQKYWDKVANDKEFTTPFQLDQFQNHVPKDSPVLDIGCGYGRTMNELNNAGYSNLLGVDFSQNMIERGKSLFPYLDFRKIDNGSLPFDDNHFTAVILLAVLTCIISDQDQEQFVSEIRRIMKDDGIIYINDFLMNNDKRNIDRYKRYEPRYNVYGIFELPEGALVRHHSEERIKYLTRQFNMISYKPVVYKTMNGNQSNGFYYLGKKSPVRSLN